MKSPVFEKRLSRSKKKWEGTSRKDFVTISVADSGAGMSEEVQRRMFEPFFTTNEPTMSGLGATLAYGIVK
ncbi:unnamed protein product [marine sediment metagenome]|uniref:Histidine kinase/HSP90-like ATPase domain-containing protein n=1 Tax=marine sediment metagenome TaxID=412755 RepID=X1HAM2_9ZZZZ